MPLAAATAIAAIDSHAHVFARGLPLAAVRRHVPDHDATLAEYLGLLDAHGISHGVLVQPSFLGTDNRFLLGALRACPARLRGVAVVDPATADDTLLHAMDEAGVCGIRLNLVGMPLPDFSQPGWRQLFARVQALDWHVELHRESRDMFLAAQPVLDAGCALVVDHFGRPASSDIAADEGFAWLLGAAGSRRLWVKLSAAYRNWSPASSAPARDAAQALLEALGPARLVWGSDWPHTQHRELADYTAAHAALADWVPDADARRQILVDTPAHLFKFKTGDNHDQ